MTKKDNGADVIERPPQIDKEVKDKSVTKKPPLYRVILVNDDVTPFELVTHVCATVFKISAERAFHIMLTAHRQGCCLVACYAKDIAETKAELGMTMGRSKGFPLTFTVEPNDDGSEE